MRFLRALYLSVYDALREDFTYHASALTLQLLLVLAPMLLFFVTLSFYTPLVDFEKLEAFLEREMPSQTSTILRELLKVKEHGKTVSLFSLFLSYFFSVNFVRKVSRSFYYIVEERHLKRSNLFFLVSLPIWFLLFGISVSVLFSLSVYLKAKLPGMLKTLPDLFASVPVMATVFALYVAFIRAKRKEAYLLAILIVFLGTFLLQFLFTLYTAYIFKGSILYGSLSTVILFLLWLNANFTVLLIGARFIERYDSLP